MGSSFWVPNAPSPSTDLVLCTAQEQFLVSPQEETRLWIKNAEGFFERLCNTHITVLDAALKSGQVRVARAFLLPSCAQMGGSKEWELNAHRPSVNTFLAFSFSFSNPAGHHGDPKQGWHLDRCPATSHVSPGVVWSRVSRIADAISTFHPHAIDPPATKSFSSTPGIAHRRKIRNSMASQASVVSLTWATRAS